MTLDSIAASPDTEPTDKPRRVSQRVAVSVAYASGTVMSAMDIHIVNVALPSISRAFHSPLASVQWTAIGYALSLAIVIPVSGWIGDRFGTKRVFLFALAAFGVSSALCGLATNLPELVGFRVLQGAGGGMMTPVAGAMLFRTYPPEERARVTRRLLLPIVISPAIAPVLGGLLIDKLSWRWVFYINVPIAIAALIFGAVFLTEHRQGISGGFDLPGFILSGGGIALLLYAISEGSLTSWTSSRVLATGIVGIVVLVLFVVMELRRQHPMLKLRLFHDRIFRATNITSSFNFAAFFGILFLVPVFLQEVRGLSALNSGLTTFPEALGVMVASQPIGRLYGRFGPRMMMGVGSAAFAIPLALFVFVGPDTNLWLVRVLMFFVGFNNTSFLVSTQTAMFTTISPAEMGHGSAISNAQRQVSLSVGIAILTTVVTVVHGSRYTAFHAAFAAAAGFALLAAILAASLIHTKDAAATMVRHQSRRARRASAPD